MVLYLAVALRVGLTSCTMTTLCVRRVAFMSPARPKAGTVIANTR